MFVIQFNDPFLTEEEEEDKEEETDKEKEEGREAESAEDTETKIKKKKEKLTEFLESEEEKAFVMLQQNEDSQDSLKKEE